MPIICEGCGQRLAIPEGYRRNKIQCACGVICAVPESARPKADAAPKRPAVKPPRTLEEEAERWLLDDEPTSTTASAPPSFRDPEPVEEPAPAGKPAVFEMRFSCRRCGRLVRRQGECPDCNADTMPAATQENPVGWPSVDELPDDKSEEEEDASPYGVEGADDVKCPKCCFMLPPGSVLCVRCGFHLQKRKKIAKTYQPIERLWETNASYQSRLMVFWCCEAAFAALGLVGVFRGGADLGVFIGSFLGLTAMLAFLFGTFDRIHLTRDARGRVQLTKMWRVAFFARTPRTIDVRGYEGIASGRHRPVSPWDAWLLYFLIIFGIIPGIIWWYLVFYRITYHVALTRDHGFPEYLVYSGSGQTQMKEIAYSLRDASGLRYEEG
ncbi:MAG: hypothetical protein ACRELG_21455 [Gemmataceae bacterium]